MSAQAHWRALCEQPLAFVEARHLRACFAPAVAQAQVAQLVATPRFETRLLELLCAHHQLAPLAELPPPAVADLPVLLLPLERFAQLPRLCGAVFHAAALSQEIRGEVVTTLKQLLGTELYNLALQHRQWAGAAHLLRSPAELLDSIDRDGSACVNAWLAAQPAPLAAWLRLRLPLPAPENLRLAQDIERVRHLAQVLAPLATDLKEPA